MEGSAKKIELKISSEYIVNTNNIKNVDTVRGNIESLSIKNRGTKINGNAREDIRIDREINRKVKNKVYGKVLSNYSTAYLSIGSNVGDREKNLRKAVSAINKHSDITIIVVSSIYKTEPMYVKDQDYFYNIALRAEVKKSFSPFELLGFLKKIEYEMGRKKAGRKYGPRIIDIDILYYGNVYIDSNFLTIPHPKISERNFVLVPLSEISPDFKIGGKNIKKYIDEGNFTEKVDLVKNW